MNLTMTELISIKKKRSRVGPECGGMFGVGLQLLAKLFG